jgi:hypothetical protein
MAQLDPVAGSTRLSAFERWGLDDDGSESDIEIDDVQGKLYVKSQLVAGWSHVIGKGRRFVMLAKRWSWRIGVE